eukprot:2931510-Rhodomonas_salina.2
MSGTDVGLRVPPRNQTLCTSSSVQSVPASGLLVFDFAVSLRTERVYGEREGDRGRFVPWTEDGTEIGVCLYQGFAALSQRQTAAPGTDSAISYAVSGTHLLYAATCLGAIPRPVLAYYACCYIPRRVLRFVWPARPEQSADTTREGSHRLRYKLTPLHPPGTSSSSSN